MIQPDGLKKGAVGVNRIDFIPLGDSAVIIRAGNQIDQELYQTVKKICDYLTRHPIPGMTECTLSYSSVTVYYDPIEVHRRTPARQTAEKRESPYQTVLRWLQQAIEDCTTDPLSESRLVEIPVCYGGDFGPDLPAVAKHNGLTEQEVIDIHAGGEYLVYMIGFAPGFPYMGGMSERIAAPRRSTPRIKIPSGTVGIAGSQTGIYPIETPGGWQLIGRTPLQLFRPNQDPPSLLQAGDRVRFRPITHEQYLELEEDRQHGN